MNNIMRGGFEVYIKYTVLINVYNGIGGHKVTYILHIKDLVPKTLRQKCYFQGRKVYNKNAT